VTLSRSTASRICEQIKDEFAAFVQRGLSDLRLDDLFLDGANLKVHEHSPAEPVLRAWGIDTDGKPRLVGSPRRASSQRTPGGTSSRDSPPAVFTRRCSSSPRARRG